MNKITKICHLADIHIRKSPSRNLEYEMVFKNLITSLKKTKPSRIVISGDLVHDYLNLQGEQLILANEFLKSLSDIAPVRLIRGNHDYLAKNKNRVDSVMAIVKTLDKNNVIYYNKTGFYEDENVIWAVWHHGEKHNNPWSLKEAKTLNREGKVVIDLFHDIVNGAKTVTGLDIKSRSLHNVNKFLGDYGFLGDIHKLQYLNKEKTIAYSSSLIAQNFGEGDDNFHGYLLWDIVNGEVEEVSIANEYSYKNVNISPFTDFDDLDFEIDNPTKHMRIRFVWNTLPQTRIKDNERKLKDYVVNKYGNVKISNMNQFIETNKIDVDNKIDINNITDITIQQEVIEEYLEEIGTDEDIIKRVIDLDSEITKLVNIEDNGSVEWNVIKFGGENFMSYEKFDIDWRNNDGLYQILGKNTAGKTTIYKVLFYILFGKIIETESRVKFGDLRFVNNRNGAKYTEAYAVIEGNNEYYGIKRRTEVKTNKDGEVNGTPTTVNYHILESPDDKMTDDNIIDNLDDNDKNKIQKKIESIIGSYENFKRIVITTADSLNSILSSDPAVFTDSLLFDSGLDIYDKKLDAFKEYRKTLNKKKRVVCDINQTQIDITNIENKINDLKREIDIINTVNIINIDKRINKGEQYIEDLIKKLYVIDSNIANLDIEQTNKDIEEHLNNIKEYNGEIEQLKDKIKPLKDTYDEDKYNTLITKRDKHKELEYANNINIKNIQQQIREEEHKIELINGDIVRLKEDGAKYKEEIKVLSESKTCSQCTQKLLPEHQEHINKNIENVKDKMFKVADNIKQKENVDKVKHSELIKKLKQDIVDVENKIIQDTLSMEKVLKEIGVLTNDKNDVEKRKEYTKQLNQIPIKLQNEELKLSILRNSVLNYENNKKQIKNNETINKDIDSAKVLLETIKAEKTKEIETLFNKKNEVKENENSKTVKKELIEEFKEQEKHDNVMSLYMSCIHRDGVPRQILTKYILPKINETLQDILSVAEFKIWLDSETLRPRLVYYDRPDSIIDCIGSSGKERTFASVVLKFALNQINTKSKPSIFLLDEIMGKLLDESVDEFIEILDIIKSKMRKVLIIEHYNEVNPDYFINVELDDKGISSLSLDLT